MYPPTSILFSGINCSSGRISSSAFCSYSFLLHVVFWHLPGYEMEAMLSGALLLNPEGVVAEVRRARSSHLRLDLAILESSLTKSSLSSIQSCPFSFTFCYSGSQVACGDPPEMIGSLRLKGIHTVPPLALNRVYLPQ